MDLKALYASMLRTRYFEEEVGRLASEGLVYGTYHLAIGQEAVSSGTAAALHDGDWIVPTHRCHGYNAARGSDLRRMFSEILGSRDGLCGGLGGWGGGGRWEGGILWLRRPAAGGEEEQQGEEQGQQFFSHNGDLPFLAERPP